MNNSQFEFQEQSSKRGDAAMFIPTVIERTSKGERVLDVLSSIYGNRIVQFWGEVNDESIFAVRAQFLHLDKESDQDITFYINSGGGSVVAGLALFATIKNMRSDVVTVAEGVAASMGSFFLTCCGTVGKRYVMPHTTVMFHDIAWSLGYGKHTQQMPHVKHSEQLKQTLYELISLYTGQPMDYLHECMDNGDFFLTPEEAVAFGAADFVVPVPKFDADSIVLRQRMLDKVKELKLPGHNLANKWSDETLRSKLHQATKSK